MEHRSDEAAAWSLEAGRETRGDNDAVYTSDSRSHENGARYCMRLYALVTVGFSSAIING